MNTGAWMWKRIKSTISNLVLLVISTVIAYGIGEVFVRVWMPQPMLPRYVMDAPYGVRKNMPSMSYWHTSPDYRVNVRTNAHGIRSDREIPYEKPPGAYRILGLGDSFTMGYEVDVEDTYLYQLEKQLHDRGFPNAEVINLGVSGFGTTEELITLREEGLKYDPDMVLLGYFVNDINNNVMSNLFSVRDDTLRRKSAAYLPATMIQKRLFAIPGYNLLADNSQFLNLFRNYISYQIQQALYQHNRQTAAALSSVDAQPREEIIKQDVYEATLTARLLDEIYRECAKRHIPFLLLNIPITSSKANTIFSNIPLDYMRFADDIIYVDAQKIVGPYLGKRPIQWEKWHGHWRPWVHHRVAEALADTVMTYLPRNERYTDGSPLSRSHSF